MDNLDQVHELRQLRREKQVPRATLAHDNGHVPIRSFGPVLSGRVYR